MDFKIQQIHERALSILKEIRKEKPDLTFSLRKSDRYNRLTNGYWFYGNDEYVAISFWSGTDWKNKTPNIIFVINKEGESSLDFTSFDSDEKRKFFEDNMLPSIKGLEPSGKYLHKDYSEFYSDYEASLKSFVLNDKIVIDNIINAYSDKYFIVEEKTFNRIGFIAPEELKKRLENLEDYRNKLNDRNRFGPIISLLSLEIENYFPITKLQRVKFQPDSQWIFLTGMNGTGKSSLLKAITSALCSNWDNQQMLINVGVFKFKIELKKEQTIEFHEINIHTPHRADVLSIGMAAYGAARQNVLSNQADRQKSSLAYSMFNTDGKLLGLDNEIISWKEMMINKGSTYFPEAEERIVQIAELLPDLIPSLVKIELPEKTINGIWSYTQYTEEDEKGINHQPVEFDELASGLRSLVGMLGDMLIRLFAMQREITDPAKLKGIVLIDEIDVHLHPILQRKLVEDLTNTFPRIQFIVSTHSPIPILGAPKNSEVFVVNRSSEGGVTLKKMDKLNIENLLPNAMLTSPIFGMDELIPLANENERKLILDDNFSDIELFNRVRKRIIELTKTLKD